MSNPLIPNAEQVAKAWLVAAVDGLSGNVATALPDVPWYHDEFIQIMKVGGSPEIDTPLLHPVISVNCYAMKQNSRRPPWNQANELAMRVLKAAYEQAFRFAPDPTVTLTLAAGFMAARICSVYPLSEINRLPSDPSQYAAYTLDLQFTWVPDGWGRLS